jgi:DNA relaxase NicK
MRMFHCSKSTQSESVRVQWRAKRPAERPMTWKTNEPVLNEENAKLPLLQDQASYIVACFQLCGHLLREAIAPVLQCPPLVSSAWVTQLSNLTTSNQPRSQAKLKRDQLQQNSRTVRNKNEKIVRPWQISRVTLTRICYDTVLTAAMPQWTQCWTCFSETSVLKKIKK